MWKFIVTWCIQMMVTDPCPDAGKVDEFGRLENYGIGCTVHHFHFENECGYSIEYCAKDSALAFYERATKERDIVNVKLDSILCD